MSHTTDKPPQVPASSTAGDPIAMADELLVVGGAVPFDKTTA